MERRLPRWARPKQPIECPEDLDWVFPVLQWLFVNQHIRQYNSYQISPDVLCWIINFASRIFPPGSYLNSEQGAALSGYQIAATGWADGAEYLPPFCQQVYR